MRTTVAALAAASFIALGGCGYFESKRVISQSEKELGVKFTGPPKVLASESYGWAEEGGDRALLRLNAVDCVLVAKKLINTDPVGIESKQMFAAAGAAPVIVRRRFEMDQNQDTREYELDEVSCLLFRQAHFE